MKKQKQNLLMLLTMMFLGTACVEQKFAELELDATQDIAEEIFDGNLPPQLEDKITETQQEEQQEEEQEEEQQPQVIVTTTGTDEEEEQTQAQDQTQAQEQTQEQEQEQDQVISTTNPTLPTSPTTETEQEQTEQKEEETTTPVTTQTEGEEEEGDEAEEQLEELPEDELVSEITETSFCARHKYAVEYAERDILACDTPGKGEKKFLVCHKNHGRRGGMSYIQVAEPAVFAHESHHGDYVVDCKILQELPKGKKLKDFNCECN